MENIFIECKDGFNIHIPVECIKYIYSLSNILEDMDLLSNPSKNVSIPFNTIEHKSLEYMLNIIEYIINNDTINMNKFIENLPTLDLCNTLYTTNFLECIRVYNVLIKQFCKIIHNNDVDTLRILLGEKNDWSKDEYADIVNDHKWCIKSEWTQCKILQKLL